jgi:hypothetical protein
MATENNQTRKTNERIRDKARDGQRDVANNNERLAENKQSNSRHVRQSKHGISRAINPKATLTNSSPRSL